MGGWGSRVLFLTLLLGGCTSPAAEVDAPEWVQAMVVEIASEPVTNPPTRIYRYTYQNVDVYYRPQRCCDIPSILWNAEGEILCAPDGGVTGDGDGQCPDFADERSDEEMVWSDSRDGAAVTH